MVSCGPRSTPAVCGLIWLTSSQPETMPALSQSKGGSKGGLRLRQCEFYRLLANFEYNVSQMLID